ncbi:hypothetical protein CkaCkLH20_05515 [Colletotrichum karsti]|uniref:Carboxylic ester hydrolase n=1 Tax=Colletotrichum karsti TaxID=1095194 RepID=A0A9P6I6P8_9PEZI|nr:uncharacterized protein CkaCkLH20_05515 [Colletotrichum karsti]KAF9877249.1 hypothetical protein CkaCkLH20_05515 [Colletotrichum karsti]
MHAQKLLLLSAGSTAATQPTATISGGVIQGISTNLPNGTATVNKFLGIPYAAPPTRFSRAEPPKPWMEFLHTTEFGPACLQNFGLNELGPRPELLETLFNTPKAPESEDCLTINIFAPATNSPKSTRAVLVFIPGGGWQLGHGRSDLSAFAAYEDIIAITLNYRTNVFGFPSSPDIPVTERNLGLYDQRLALDWIQQNIDSFGGDPSKVTIWGESAGSFAVDLHLKSYANELPLLFRAAITSSGQMSFGPLALPFASDDKTWKQLASAVGCANDAGLDCMKDVSSEKLVNAMREKKISFGPQTDNVTVLSNPAELWRGGQVVKVPILTGTVAEEGRGLVNDQVNLTTFLDAYLPTGLVAKETRDEIVSVYRSSLTSDFDIASAIYTDYFWSCPQSILATTAASKGISTWRYVFNTSILNLLPEEYAWLGKFHGSEVILLFTDPSSTPYTPQAYSVYEYLRGAIGRFVRNPTAGPGWASVGSADAPLDALVLGDAGDVPAVASPVNGTLLDRKCGLYRDIYSLLELARR